MQSTDVFHDSAATALDLCRLSRTVVAPSYLLMSSNVTVTSCSSLTIKVRLSAYATIFIYALRPVATTYVCEVSM